MYRTVAAISVMVLLPAAARAQIAEEVKDGFISMFNGKDFSGWRFGKDSMFFQTPKNWSVEESMIKLAGGGSPHLASQWDYEDFDMRFQWKALKKGYNSGFYVRSGRTVSANQINLAQSAAGNLMGMKGGPAVPKLQKNPGEWNEWRVLAVGDKLTFWCNGEQAWEVTGFKPARGYVGLQAEGAAIDFKDFRIKELGYVRLDKVSAWQETAGWNQGADAGIANVVLTDALVADAKSKPLTLAKTPAQFTLRLEYIGDAALQRGGKTLLALADTDIKKYANPLPQWNYFEIALKANKLRITINGNTLAAMRDAPDTGDLGVVPSGPLALRNIRIRAD
jgi:hypothetical protein